MKKRTLLAAAAVPGMLLIGAAFALFSKHGGLQRETRTFPVMGTIAGLDLYGSSRQILSDGADEAQEAIRHVEALCSIFDPQSELSRLNTSAFETPFQCSDDLWDILTRARKYYFLSGGSFDVTVKPLMRLWGFHRKIHSLPDRGKIAAALKTVGLDKVLFDEEHRTVRFTVNGLGIDLGGIAKGYALDKAKAVLLKRGIRCGILDIGGNLMCLPQPLPGRSAWRVGIRNPVCPERVMTVVPMLNGAIATSGDYERYVVIEGKHYAHIIDARTGYPVENMLSVSVIAPEGMDSDALSTVLFLNGPAFAEKFHRDHPEISILMIRRDPADREHILTEPFGSVWEKDIKIDFPVR